jgi:hypothetical protein
VNVSRPACSSGGDSRFQVCKRDTPDKARQAFDQRFEELAGCEPPLTQELGLLTDERTLEAPVRKSGYLDAPDKTSPAVLASADRLQLQLRDQTVAGRTIGSDVPQEAAGDHFMTRADEP